MRSYNHLQSSGSSVWEVNHNLNTTSVICDVYIDDGVGLEKVYPSAINHEDSNLLSVHFPINKVGIVRVVA